MGQFLPESLWWSINCFPFQLYSSTFSAVASTSPVSLFLLRSRRSMTWQVHTVDVESSFCFAAFRNRKTYALNSPDENGRLGWLSILSLSQPRKPHTTNLIHTKQNNLPRRLPDGLGRAADSFQRGTARLSGHSAGSWDLRSSNVSASPGSFGEGCCLAVPASRLFSGGLGGFRGWCARQLACPD